MSKYYRMNTCLGCIYEIPEKLALKKINSKYWVRHYDDYWQEFTNMWMNTKDSRDVIFKSEE